MDIFLIVWCICKLNLDSTLDSKKYEGYECVVGEIGVEGWADTLIRLCDLVC